MFGRPTCRPPADRPRRASERGRRHRLVVECLETRELLSATPPLALGVNLNSVDFYTTALTPNEVLTEIRVPLPSSGTGTAYHKMAHPASGYVVVSAGALVVRDPSGRCASARVAIGGLASGPLRATAAETALQGQPLTAEVISAAALKAADEGSPEDDSYASADYKRHIATVLARRAIESAVGRAK